MREKRRYELNLEATQEVRMGLNVDEIILSKNDKAVFERLLNGKVEIEFNCSQAFKSLFFSFFFLYGDPTLQASETKFLASKKCVDSCICIP